ncbi:MAG: CRISPR-associated protein Cas4 [Anaerolineae bacterium]|nr:CRISPR-associated protein Cas4 [Anaerolineae bacterium]
METLIPSDAPLAEEATLDFLTVTDLKQHAHCPRFTFFEHLWPAVRPRTYKMDAGDDAHERERERARRRSLREYGLPDGERRFAVRVESAALRLRGEIDELVIAPGGVYLPVDYKLSKAVSESFRVQITAYAMLVEVQFGATVTTGYIYLIARRSLVPVDITAERRGAILRMLAAMRTMIRAESMPPPVRARAKCRDCEFRRFCNDV